MSQLSTGTIALLAASWTTALLCALAGAWTFRRALRGTGAGAGPGGIVAATALLAAGGTGAFVVWMSMIVLGTPELVEGRRASTKLVGSEAPAVTWTRLEGGEGSLEGYREKVVLVNVWATWCGPCRREMPALEKLQRDYREHGLVVVHLSEEDESTIRRFLDRHPSANEHGRDPTPRLPSAALPTTYVVDRAGVVRDDLVGARSYDDFEDAIDDWI